MLRKVVSHLSYANVMATVALFVAIGGGAYAAGLAKNSVGSKQIKAKAVKNPELANDVVTSPKVKDGSLLSADFASGQLPPGPDTPEQLTEKLRQSAEPWQEVGPAGTTTDLCLGPGNTGVFCGDHNVSDRRWQNYGGGFATAGFYKDQIGIVHLKGLVRRSGGTEGSSTPTEYNVFRLPPGYRPDHRRLLVSVGRDGFAGRDVAAARFDVHPNGLVTFITDCADGGAGGVGCSATVGDAVTLEGISFRPDE